MLAEQPIQVQDSLAIPAQGIEQIHLGLKVQVVLLPHQQRIVQYHMLGVHQNGILRVHLLISQRQQVPYQVVEVESLLNPVFWFQIFQQIQEVTMRSSCIPNPNLPEPFDSHSLRKWE